MIDEHDVTVYADVPVYLDQRDPLRSGRNCGPALYGVDRANDQAVNAAGEESLQTTGLELRCFIRVTQEQADT